ncbi:MAG: TetR/AcrR family transcriptional regulator [Robiginitomaculum sp.]|nr:TetR/AcrR family transcriptional regulator [Robiginitomaculum sp.]MDQ7076277.1 TetR/AcrR family transcriptional regulator [Robiginitomaculum sp.]
MSDAIQALDPQNPQKSQGKRAIRETNERLIMEAAEQEFALSGFKGATTDAIARRAGVPKANLHYYFSTKAALYRRVIEDVCEHWLAAAQPFDETDDPRTALRGYIKAKMDQARTRPFGSRVWAMEVIRGAPVIDGYLHTVLKPWYEARNQKLKEWIRAGKMDPIDTQALFFMIWATTQHYADFDSQIRVLNHDRPLSDEQFSNATDQVCKIILTGIGLKS